jgi:hypothetical protein
VSAARESLTQEELQALPDSVIIGAALYRTLGYRTPQPVLGGLDVDLALMTLLARIDGHPDRERAAVRRDELAARCAALLAEESGSGTATLDPFDALDLDES